MRRGRSEKGYVKFGAKKEGVSSVREMVKGTMSWETMEGEAGEWIEKGRNDGSVGDIRMIKKSGKMLFMVRVIERI
jgi:hypothetical protein